MDLITKTVELFSVRRVEPKKYLQTLWKINNISAEQ